MITIKIHPCKKSVYGGLETLEGRRLIVKGRVSFMLTNEVLLPQSFSCFKLALGSKKKQSFRPRPAKFFSQ